MIDHVEYDAALGAICITEELHSYQNGEHPYEWARQIQNSHGIYALRAAILKIAVAADSVYEEICKLDGNDDTWDCIAYDCEYIPAFMKLAVNNDGSVKEDAIYIMDSWRFLQRG